MFFGIVIGIVATYLFLAIFGQQRINKELLKGYDAYIKHVKNGRLVVNDYLTVEDVMYVCMKLVAKDKKKWASFVDYLPLPVTDPKDVGHNE
jgi:hypothetical protein